MKSQWRITSQYINDKQQFAIMRLKDMDKTIHSGNMEFATGYMPEHEKAVQIMEELNTAHCLCKDCINYLQEYNPYTYPDGTSIPIEFLHILKVPSEECEGCLLDEYFEKDDEDEEC